MIDTDIKTRIKLLEPAYVDFLKGDFANQAAVRLGGASGFDEDQIILLSNGIMLYLLVFLDLEGLINFITDECEVAKEVASALAGSVISSLPDEFVQVHETAYIKLNPEPESEDSGANLSSDIAETEAAISSIPAFNTHKTDATDSETVEGTVQATSQSSILDQDDPPRPSHSDTGTPRWGSET